jgi:hypothetical protein
VQRTPHGTSLDAQSLPSYYEINRQHRLNNACVWNSINADHELHPVRGTVEGIYTRAMKTVNKV